MRKSQSSKYWQLVKLYILRQTVLPNSTIAQPNTIHKEFIWNYKRPKIKEKTLINSFDKSGLKNIDIPSKITSPKSSWVKRLFDKHFHEWKIIPLFVTEKYFEKIFKLHGSLDILNFAELEEIFVSRSFCTIHHTILISMVYQTYQNWK